MGLTATHTPLHPTPPPLHPPEVLVHGPGLSSLRHRKHDGLEVLNSQYRLDINVQVNGSKSPFSACPRCTKMCSSFLNRLFWGSHFISEVFCCTLKTLHILKSSENSVSGTGIRGEQRAERWRSLLCNHPTGKW